jgi:hypothetical protein
MRNQTLKAAAYHEAAHAVAFVRHAIRFRSIYLCDDDGVITLSDGTCKTDANGTVEMDDPKWPYVFLRREGDEREIPVLTTLVGIAATKRLLPHHSYSRIIEGGPGLRDWLDAIRYVNLCSRWNEGQELSREAASVFLWLCLRRAREFVKREWEAISRLGNSLIGSTTRALSFDQVDQIISTE